LPPLPFHWCTSPLRVHNRTALPRKAKWLFDAPHDGSGNSAGGPDVYALFDLRLVRWDVIVAQAAEIGALVLFSVLHVPINIPSLAISAGVRGVDVNTELGAHAVGNLFAGLVGAPPNYLCYANSARACDALVYGVVTHKW
jgi:SulP family sulfate permease